VPGFLVPQAGLLKIKSSRTGFVSQLPVVQGDLVIADQLLLSLHDPSQLLSGASVGTQLLDKLDAQEVLLKERLSGLVAISLTQNFETKAKLESLTLERKSLSSQVSITQQRLQLATSQVERMEALAQANVTARIKVDEAQNLLLQLQSQQTDFIRAVQSNKSQTVQYQLQQKRQQLQANNDQAQLRYNLLDIDQRRLQLQGEQQSLINAPRDGLVAQVLVKHNELVQQGQVVMHLMPENSLLQAQLLVPTQAIGFISEGQTVNIRYAAFPYQKFGLYTGVVSQVSQTILTANETSDLPFPTQTAAYKVMVRLDAQAVRAYGRSMALRPGMQVSVDIRLEERSLWEWLLEPLLSLKGRFS
jgi:membrane fusion protein